MLLTRSPRTSFIQFNFQLFDSETSDMSNVQGSQLLTKQKLEILASCAPKPVVRILHNFSHLNNFLGPFFFGCYFEFRASLSLWNQKPWGFSEKLEVFAQKLEVFQKSLRFSHESLRFSPKSLRFSHESLRFLKKLEFFARF